jgi:hypothetical protein
VVPWAPLGQARGDAIEAAFCRRILELRCEVLAGHRRAIRALGLDASTLSDTSCYDVVTTHPFGGTAAHEVKGKFPHTNSCYGFEDRRLQPLIQTLDGGEHDWVLYTIYDTRDERWVTADIVRLRDVGERAEFPSYDGRRPEVESGWYWPTSLWKPLEEVFW